MRKTIFHFEQISLDAIRKIADAGIAANAKVRDRKAIVKLPGTTKTNGARRDSVRPSRPH